MRIAILAAAALALAGCTTTAVDENIARNLPKICAASEAAYLAFLAVDTVKPVPAKVSAKVDAARAVLVPACADPTQATSLTVVTAAFNAYVAIQAARQSI